MVRLWNAASLAAVLVAAVAVGAADAQPPVARPQPPPPPPGAKTPVKPGAAPAPAQAPATPREAGTKPSPPAAVPASMPRPAAVDGPPTACQQGAPVMSGAQYLESYDAGMGQSFCLYGSAQTFTEVVLYYRTVLKDRGELVFDVPATHMFEVGRFKESEVAFPPGVTGEGLHLGRLARLHEPETRRDAGVLPTVIQNRPAAARPRQPALDATGHRPVVSDASISTWHAESPTRVSAG